MSEEWAAEASRIAAWVRRCAADAVTIEAMRYGFMLADLIERGAYRAAGEG